MLAVKRLELLLLVGGFTYNGFVSVLRSACVFTARALQKNISLGARTCRASAEKDGCGSCVMDLILPDEVPWALSHKMTDVPLACVQAVEARQKLRQRRCARVVSWERSSLPARNTACIIGEGGESRRGFQQRSAAVFCAQSSTALPSETSHVRFPCVGRQMVVKPGRDLPLSLFENRPFAGSLKCIRS